VAGACRNTDVTRCLGRWIALIVAFWVTIADAHAGMVGQPRPTDDTIARLRSAVRQFLIDGGDIGKARPDLILLVERDLTADVTDLLSPALYDDGAYNGVASTYADALTTMDATDAKRPFLLYNLARLHLFRANVVTTAAARKQYLDAAARVAGKFPERVTDPAVWELRGDVEAARGNTDAAVVAYRKMGATGGTPVVGLYKVAMAYQTAHRYAEAQAAYEAAARADRLSPTGGRQLLHLIYQGIASIALQQERLPAALRALDQSANVSQDPAAPFRLRLDIARQLLRRGYGTSVAAYAAAAVKLAPDDEDAKALLAEARGAGGR
jgi:tetratricopeptide (TPR) repeat protein